MTKSERYKQEMLVRVRDFGAAHGALFPESSPGGERFAQVATAVAAVEQHLKALALGSASARGVKASTRAAVLQYMKTLAKAARRISRTEREPNPFKLPRRNLLQVQVGTAQAFLVEAERRQAAFVAIGLPPTFISDYRVLVDELTQAFYGRLNSKTLRATAQAGVRAAIRQGLEVVRDLEVLVEIATRQDPVLATAWRVARTIEGQGASASARAKNAAVTIEPSPPAPPVAEPAPFPDVAAPAAAPGASAADDTIVEAPALALEKAS
jgi:hypothetical protein